MTTEAQKLLDAPAAPVPAQRAYQLLAQAAQEAAQQFGEVEALKIRNAILCAMLDTAEEIEAKRASELVRLSSMLEQEQAAHDGTRAELEEARRQLRDQAKSQIAVERKKRRR